MTLVFPNPCRSFDATQRCVRFWAHDEALEISYFVEEGALCRIDPKAARDEAGLLDAFDRHRDRILKAATGVYKRHSRGSYILAAADM